MYSLAGLYYRGQGVEQDFEQALNLYKKSSEKDMPYASFELAKMYREGLGVNCDQEQAEIYFQKAFDGFSLLEQKSKDDKLQYRLGQMLYSGTGTPKDINAAIDYLEQSAKMGNDYAQYLLAKIYLEIDDVENSHIQKALKWFKVAGVNRT